MELSIHVVQTMAPRRLTLRREFLCALRMGWAPPCGAPCGGTRF
jgi:hypothetical protein